MADSFLRITNGVDILYIGVCDDPETGEVIPLAQIIMGSLDMWLAVADGVAVIVDGSEGERFVVAPLDWIAKTFDPETTTGLERIREVLREEGLLPSKPKADS